MYGSVDCDRAMTRNIPLVESLRLVPRMALIDESDVTNEKSPSWNIRMLRLASRLRSSYRSRLERFGHDEDWMSATRGQLLRPAFAAPLAIQRESRSHQAS